LCLAVCEIARAIPRDVALAREFKAHFPSQTAQLLDELAAILRSPSESVDAAASKAVNAVAKEGARQAKTVRRAGRLAKREAKLDAAAL
jgi:hypothetical protein